MVDKGLTWVWPGYWAELSQQNNFCATSLCTITYNCRKGILYTLHFTLNRSNALYTLHFTVAMHNAYPSVAAERGCLGVGEPPVFTCSTVHSQESGETFELVWHVYTLALVSSRLALEVLFCQQCLKVAIQGQLERVGNGNVVCLLCRVFVSSPFKW